MISVREKASRERNYIQSRAKTTTNEPATVRASLTPIGNDSEGASMSEAADEPQVFNRNTQIEGIQACDPCDPAHGTEEPYDEAGVLPRPIMIPHPSECLPRRKRKSKIGRAHVCTPVTNTQLVFRILLAKNNTTK